MSKSMAMTQREKVLALIVAATVVIIGGFLGIGRVSRAFDQRQDALVQLDGSLGKQKSVVKRGDKAEDQLAEWRERSLPANDTQARTLYLNWLRSRAVAVDLQGLKLSTPSGGSRGTVFYRHVFGVNAKGDLRQLTQFLYDFYSVDYLHRITRLSVKPLRDSRQIDINITIEAIAIAGTPDRQSLPEPPANRLVRAEVQDYVQKILNRNLFSPPNQPPKVEFVAMQRVNPGKELRIKIPAKDPESDKMKFEIEGEDVPDGVTINHGGEVVWRPSKEQLRKDEYVVPFRVTDEGWPSKSSTGAIKIAVVEPDEEDPEFDPATMATISAINRTSSGPVVWINNKTKGEVLQLLEGDKVSVGTFKGTIAKISVQNLRAEIETEDGKKIQLRLGSPLVSADLGGI